MSGFAQAERRASKSRGCRGAPRWLIRALFDSERIRSGLPAQSDVVIFIAIYVSSIAARVVDLPESAR
jgi:hypothetical protein